MIEEKLDNVEHKIDGFIDKQHNIDMDQYRRIEILEKSFGEKQLSCNERFVSKEEYNKLLSISEQNNRLLIGTLASIIVGVIVAIVAAVINSGAVI